MITEQSNLNNIGKCLGILEVKVARRAIKACNVFLKYILFLTLLFHRYSGHIFGRLFEEMLDSLMQIIFCIFCFDIFDEIYSFLNLYFLTTYRLK